jgi:ABC-type Fe3+ transport system permease subunit
MGDEVTSTASIVGETNIINLINKGLAYAILIAIVLSVIFVFYGGITFILSGGKEEKVKSAMNTIRYAIIGLVVTVFATTFIALIGKLLGYDLISQITDINRIMQDVQAIISSLQGDSTTTSGTGL